MAKKPKAAARADEAVADAAPVVETFVPTPRRAPESAELAPPPSMDRSDLPSPDSANSAPPPASPESASNGSGQSDLAPSDSAPAAGDPSPGATPTEDRNSPPPAPAAIEEPWWKRKRDKKKQKWLERQQQGRGAQPHQSAAPSARAAHPPQPPPPVQVQHFGDLPNPARFHDLAALDSLAAEIGAGQASPLYLDHIYALNLAELTLHARQLGVALEGVPNRRQVMEGVLRLAAERKTPIFDRGWLDLSDRAHGFVVHERFNYRLYPENCYVPESLIRRFGLKRGHQLEVVAQGPQPGERCPAALAINSVMGRDPFEAANVPPFEELTHYYPLKRILLEAPEIHKDISMRAIDLLTPVGFGQRGLIVAPPRTGKTVLLQNIANSVSNNYPEARLIILLVDERPEEVTDFRRHTKGEVVSSTFDEATDSHVHAAEMVIEKSRRLVELGDHVVILLDSITRLARAYNALAANSGKIMSGGLEATALQRPKRFFGSARNIEGAGSLTILGTALIDTGSRMDEIIFEEFKGTGNMELHLDRGLSDTRVVPAINIDRSGTRKEELIYHPEEMLRVYGPPPGDAGHPAGRSDGYVDSTLEENENQCGVLARPQPIGFASSPFCCILFPPPPNPLPLPVTSAEDFVIQLALEKGLIKQHQIDSAREQIAQHTDLTTAPPKVVDLLVAEKIVEPLQLSKLLADEFGMPTVDLGMAKVAPDMITLVPRVMAARYTVFPLRREGNTLHIAISDPLDVEALDDIGHVLKLTLAPAVAPAEEIRAAIERLYGKDAADLDKMLSTFTASEGEDSVTSREGEATGAEEGDAPIIKLVHGVILTAIQRRASDIHLEPLEKALPRALSRGRRADRGRESAQAPPAGDPLPPEDHGQRVHRRKADTAGRPHPGQDGRQGPRSARVHPAHRPRREHRHAYFGQIGPLSRPPRARFLPRRPDDDGAHHRDARRPSARHRPHRFRQDHHALFLPAFHQQTRPQAHHRRGSRRVSALRYQPGARSPRGGHDLLLARFAPCCAQSPNIVMVGEIRDLETAEIAIKASLTGHMVFSTLHTNDAPGAVTRLSDIGVKPFLISAALRGIMAQRLVRKVCKMCKKPITPSATELRSLNITAAEASAATFMMGQGCPNCNGTGYRSRYGIFEIFVVTQEIQRMIYVGAGTSKLREKARSLGMRTMREDGIRKVTTGATTIEEVVSITVGDVI